MKLVNTIKRSLAVVAVAVGVVVCAPSIASASAPPPVEVDTTNTSTVAIAAPLVTVIVSLLIPLVNGFLTKPTTPSGVKAIGTIVLNAVWALFANGVLADGSALFSSATLYTALLGCVISIASYAGVYKPMNVTSNPGGSLASVGRT